MTVNMITLAAKKKCHQYLIYTWRHTAIIFECSRLKIVKLGASRCEIIFWFWVILHKARWMDSKSPSHGNEHLQPVVKRPMIVDSALAIIEYDMRAQTGKLPSTIMKNLNLLKVNDSWWLFLVKWKQALQLSSTITNYHAPFDQGFSKTRSSALQKEAIDREFDCD